MPATSCSKATTGEGRPPTCSRASSPSNAGSGSTSTRSALDERGARLLEAFVWPDQHERIERLRRAIAIARTCDIDLRRGDYVDLLPSVLAERRDDALMVVFHSVSTTYLDDDRYAQLVSVLERGGADGPLAWVSFEGPRHDPDYGGVALAVTHWPRGETRRLAKVDFHAAWLEWGG